MSHWSEYDENENGRTPFRIVSLEVPSADYLPMDSRSAREIPPRNFRHNSLNHNRFLHLNYSFFLSSSILNTKWNLSSAEHPRKPKSIGKKAKSFQLSDRCINHRCASITDPLITFDSSADLIYSNRWIEWHPNCSRHESQLTVNDHLL